MRLHPPDHSLSALHVQGINPLLLEGALEQPRAVDLGGLDSNQCRFSGQELPAVSY